MCSRSYRNRSTHFVSGRKTHLETHQTRRCGSDGLYGRETAMYKWAFKGSSSYFSPRPLGVRAVNTF